MHWLLVRSGIVDAAKDNGTDALASAVAIGRGIEGVAVSGGRCHPGCCNCCGYLREQHDVDAFDDCYIAVSSLKCAHCRV
jgi:hypothetical protein